MYKHLAVTATSTIPPMIAIMSRKLKPESSHFAIMEDALVPEERPPEQKQSIQQLLSLLKGTSSHEHLWKFGHTHIKRSSPPIDSDWSITCHSE